MNDLSFYQAHLNRVSRSFAFCIPRLEDDLRLWVSLAYLLCRLLDTIEDAPWKNIDEQLQSFEDFTSFVEKKSDPITVSVWASHFPTDIPEGEKILIADAFKIFSDLHELPTSVREKIERSVLNMLRGMRHFVHTTGTEKIRLSHLTEVNQYCFFVAGLVGELLTDLAFEKNTNKKIPGDLYVKAVHFGLFLQKINLLKDHTQDEREGRFLIHSRTEVLASLKKDAQGAIDYILLLPIASHGYRLGCAWCLFLGLDSLPWIEKSWALGLFKKIPRFITERMLHTVENCIDDNTALLKLFYKKLPKLPQVSLSSREKESPKWFFQAYLGALSRTQIEELELL